LNPRKINIIPPTNPNQPNRYFGTPEKIHVVGYALVTKGTGAGLQIRKNIRRLIADQPEWELTFVTTDYQQTENQDLTWRSFFNICNGIRFRYLDILIIHSANDLEEAFSIAARISAVLRPKRLIDFVMIRSIFLLTQSFNIL
jgi:hypothetical protein